MLYRPHRYQTRFPVDLFTPGGRLTAMVTDINQTGARIAGQTHLAIGDRVAVAALNERAEAIVRWVGEDGIGISFIPMISRKMVDFLRFAETHSRNGARFSSLGLQEMR